MPEVDITERLTITGKAGSMEWEAAAEIGRLRGECAEAYQMMAGLVAAGGLFTNAAVLKAMDNLFAAAGGWPRVHAVVLPFASERSEREN